MFTLVMEPVLAITDTYVHEPLPRNPVAVILVREVFDNVGMLVDDSPHGGLVEALVLGAVEGIGSIAMNIV